MLYLIIINYLIKKTMKLSTIWKLLTAAAITTTPTSTPSDTIKKIWEPTQKIAQTTLECAIVKWKIKSCSQEELMQLALEYTNKHQINVDTSGLAHTASLSPKIMKYYFWENFNKVDYPKGIPFLKDWAIDHDYNPTVEWNLQYLIWKTGVSTYLTLSDEHQKFIQEIADIILTDEYVQNIEEHKKDKKIPYDIVSSWEKDLKTNNLSFFVMKVVYLLKDIQEIRSWVDSQFSRAEKLLNKYQEKKWYNIPEELLQKLDELKPEIENIIKIHKLLDEQGLKNTMDYRKKEQVILDEIVRIQEELKEQNDIISWKKWILKEKDAEIKKLQEYLDTLKRFSGIVWISE